MSAYSLGRRGPDPAHKKALFVTASLPIAFNKVNPNVNYSFEFGAPEDQENVGLCVTFACTQLHELKLRLHEDIVIDISERALYSMTKHLHEPDALGEEGLYTADALLTLSQNGYVLSTDWPYNPANEQTIIEPVPTTLVHNNHPVTGYLSVPNTIEGMVRALAAHGPLIIGTTWANDWFNPIVQADGSCWLTPHPTQGPAGGHDLLAVGYSLTKKHEWGVGAFLLRNQWGNWGKGGYVWLPFQSVILPDDVYTIQL